MASGALIAEQVWAGCPVLRTWAHAFVSETSRPKRGELLHTGLGVLGTSLWHWDGAQVPVGQTGHGHNTRALRPR